MTNKSLVHTDWLGNLIREDAWVVYSSKSTNTGMNLGKVEFVGIASSGKGRMIQVRIYSQSRAGWSKGRLVSLHQYSDAYNSVTRYFGTIPQIED